MKNSGGKSAGGRLFQSEAIGIVELNGVIMDSKKTLKALKQFDKDPAIQGVVLRINSPGGSVAPSQEIYEAVKKFKKPLVASMGSVAASGGFYVACGAKKVFANPGTITGSIGVIMQFANLSKLYEWAKVKRYSLTTGKYKDAGAEYREMTAEEKALLQAMINDVLGQFKAAVRDGRHLSAEAVTAVADGRIFSGSQAKALKLVDELGGIQEAVEEVAKLAKIKGEPKIVYPSKSHKNIFDFIPTDDDAADEESRASGWLKGAVGQLIGQAQNVSQSLEPGIYWLWKGPL